MWNGLGKLSRHFPVTAPDIKNMFVTAQLQLGDQFARPNLLNSRI